MTHIQKKLRSSLFSQCSVSSELIQLAQMAPISIASTSSPRKTKKKSSSLSSAPISLQRDVCEDYTVGELHRLARRTNLVGRSRLKTKLQLCHALGIRKRPRPCFKKSGKRNNAYSLRELRALATKRKIVGRAKLRTKSQLCLKLMKSELPTSWLREQVERHVANIEFKAQKIWAGMRHSNRMRTLKGRTWLNDEVINSYGLDLINKAASSADASNRCFALSTFLVFKRDDLPRLKKTEVLALYAEKKPNGKFRKVPELETINPRYLLLPCNQGGDHWTLYVSDLKTGWIHFFDSMKGPIIALHWKAAKNHTIAMFRRLHPRKRFPSWKPFVVTDLHSQGNGYDCGVHVCILMRLISMGLIENIGTDLYASSETPFYRAMLAYEIAHKKLIPIH